VVLDLTAGDSRTFGLQVFDTNADDDMSFSWDLIVPQSNIFSPIGRGELVNSQAIGDVFAWEVPPVVLQACQGVLGNILEEPGESVILQLTIDDPIPEDQRFDPGAVAYQLVVRWTVESVGSCGP
jgi:hypothetical protein